MRGPRGGKEEYSRYTHSERINQMCGRLSVDVVRAAEAAGVRTVAANARAAMYA